ncbi:MAG TPA: macro domain-containing protein [Anaerolineae bacterium]|nr:macro domain-containing protein [Anaerolineae bacterium]
MRKTVFQWLTGDGKAVRVVHGDLTAEPVEAIVNAANEGLLHGGGVAGAIVRLGGQEIQKESSDWVREHGPVPTGQAAITTAGRLPCRFVIHAVGPVWGSGDEEAKLASALRSSLQLAAEHNLASVSLPAISSGIFGFPRLLCAQVLLDAIRDFLGEHPKSSVREVNVVLLDRAMAELFANEAQSLFGKVPSP